MSRTGASTPERSKIAAAASRRRVRLRSASVRRRGSWSVDMLASSRSPSHTLQLIALREHGVINGTWFRIVSGAMFHFHRAAFARHPTTGGSMTRFDGKTVLITGGSRGFGLTTAELL